METAYLCMYLPTHGCKTVWSPFVEAWKAQMESKKSPQNVKNASNSRMREGILGLAMGKEVWARGKRKIVRRKKVVCLIHSSSYILGCYC